MLSRNWDGRQPQGRASWCRSILFLFAIVGLLGLGFAKIGHAQQQVDYQLGSGDRLRITVFGHPDLSGEFEVGSDGKLSLPLVGDIRARGMTLQELEKAVSAKLHPDYLKNPQISAEVINYRPFYIIGEVKNPGSYPFVGGMRVVNAVAMAGGFTYRARESRMKIRRAAGSGKAEPADQNTLVHPGDVIEVPERFF